MSNQHVLLENIRRVRSAKRFSQQALADAAGLSLPAIKNIELGKVEPRVKTVQAIAGALGVRLQDLFMPVRELRTVRFRSTAKLMWNRENILARVARWLDDFNYLEEVLNNRPLFMLKETREQCSRERIVEAAGLCRERLGLNADEPIHDICGLLEYSGVKVLSVPMSSESFFGLSVAEEDGGPAVIVNVSDNIPEERRIFSAAHELGHLMLHPEAYDTTQSQENSEEEKEADLFAGHFLMPDEGFRQEWNEAAGLHPVDRVLKVKSIFRVSYKTVLFRLLEHGIADKTIWQKFPQAYQQRYNRKLPFKEEPMPFRLQRFAFLEDRFSRLAREAVEKDKISLSRGAEILGIGIEEMQDLLQSLEIVL